MYLILLKPFQETLTMKNMLTEGHSDFTININLIQTYDTLVSLIFLTLVIRKHLYLAVWLFKFTNKRQNQLSINLRIIKINLPPSQINTIGNNNFSLPSFSTATSNNNNNNKKPNNPKSKSQNKPNSTFIRILKPKNNLSRMPRIFTRNSNHQTPPPSTNTKIILINANQFLIRFICVIEISI